MPVGSMIKNLSEGLNEVGKIKIGKKGEKRKGRNGDFQLPTKTDYITITTMQEGGDGNFIPDVELMDALKEFADADGKLRKIPITLLYDDIELNFRCQYTVYKGRTLSYRSDGETAERLYRDGSWREEEHNPNEPDMKINGRLSCMIRHSNRLGGAWMFRTTSYNTVRGMISSLQMIKQITGGVLQGIPLFLKLTPKKSSNPKDGSPVTIYVMNIEFDGNQERLMSTGYGILENRVKHGIRMEQVETEARKILSAQPTAFVDENGELDSEGEEHHPEAQEGYEEAQKTERPKSTRKGATKKKEADQAEEVTPVEELEPKEDPLENQEPETEEPTVNENTEQPAPDENKWGDF